MANKQQTKKRRVAAAQQVARQQAVVGKAERRRRLIVGGIVAFMALALIAPLTAGLIADDGASEPVVTTTTVFDIPWASGEYAGATLNGPTPCPPTDGSAERITQFAQAPPSCIDDTAVYELTFDTSAGSFTVPVDSGLNTDVANLAAVFGWYHTYEQTPVTAATGGLLWVGSPGDVGFTLPIAPPTEPVNELYPVGSVLAIPGIDGGITGALMVVLDDIGASLLRTDPRYIPVGMIDDLTAHQGIYDAPESGELLLVDAVTVTRAG